MKNSIATVEKNFLRNLKKFAAHDYAFDDTHALRFGTLQDPDAKGTQREAFDAYVKGFEEGHRHGYFEIPTGVGKTALFISLLKNYIDAVNDAKDGKRALIVVPSTKLAVQTAQALAKFLPEIAPTIETDDDKGKEIDWENSQIGLQYGKVKHADRKPSILITTYQSLNRDRENKVYPPDEYGMVIYDEGHALTAAQYGLAVDKFKDAIQLAVSATPEYSEEKTVAERLPHRYYQLSIADAINRGDLCNVRPVLLKTNYTVDKKKFRQYVERNQGRKLTDVQLSDLLNQKVRNQAAMEAYLLGADPDSGERYLGQNGMIFCGSTDHADDFARQFDELLGKAKYKPVREWLKDEGVELVAPVHGKIKGAYLKKGLMTDSSGTPVTEGRKYQGTKEWYSEEEIFDLHAKGRILLLASVKKLKEGYDSPRDSFIVDLVDRLSKVDATQIDGRGFRLNEQPDEANNDPGNPNKTCTVINLVDKNTHDLYKDDPQMLPIYCAEVIEGAEFRTPAKRKHIQKHFKKEPPDLSSNLEAANFTLITDVEVVRGISKAHKEKRDATKPIEKPEGYWSTMQLADAMGASPSTTKPLLNKLALQLTDESVTHIDYNGIRIPRDALFQYTHTGKSVIAIQGDWGQKIADKHKAIPKKTDDIWSSVDMAKAISENTAPRVAHEIIQDLKKQKERSTTGKLKYQDIELPADALVEFQSNVGIATGIKREWGSKIADAYRKNVKLDEVLSGSELGKVIGASKSAGDRLIQKLADQMGDDVKHLTYHTLELPRDALVQYRSSGHSNLVYGVDKKYAPQIKAEYERVNTKPTGVLSGAEIKKRLNADGGRIMRELKEASLASEGDQFEYLGIKIPKDALVEYVNKGTPALGLKEEYADKIDKVRNQEDTRSLLKPKPITPRKSPAHMTAEERAETKRGGRGRDA